MYWEDLLAGAGALAGLGAFGWWAARLLERGRPAPEPRWCAICSSLDGRVSPARWGYPAAHARCRSKLRRAQVHEPFPGAMPWGDQ